MLESNVIFVRTQSEKKKTRFQSASGSWAYGSILGSILGFGSPRGSILKEVKKYLSLN